METERQESAGGHLKETNTTAVQQQIDTSVLWRLLSFPPPPRDAAGENKSADTDQSRTEQQLGLSTATLTILSEACCLYRIRQVGGGLK